jgi:molybdate transport system ATP-binding protein
MAIRDDGPDTVTLQLRLGHEAQPSVAMPMLLARLTRRSREALQLTAGQAVFAQIKGAALMG